MKKIVAFLLCFVMLFCAVSCNKNDDDTNDSNAVESTEKEENVTDDVEPEGSESPDEEQDAPKSPYSSIINSYKKLIGDKKDGKNISEPAATANEIEVAVYNTVVGCEDVSIMGYATKDINGDGVEELILLNDNYDIFSIFTMKDGRAVMLCDTYGVWLDGNGHIYVEKWTGGAFGRDRESYVYEISGGKLSGIVAVGFSVNVYLQKEGWYKIENGNRIDISEEEGEALYAKYDIMPNGYSPTEYTRTASGLKFIPLFESTLASQKHINTYSNSSFIGGNILKISAVSGDSVSFTFENRYTVGEFDPDTNPEPEVIETVVTSSAVLEGDRYVFEQDGIKGYIDFCVNCAWVVVTESENENVAVRAYLFDYPEE